MTPPYQAASHVFKSRKEEKHIFLKPSNEFGGFFHLKLFILVLETQK